ncbi:MAG: alpha-2-macroglobulin family protein [Spirochaetota bacterium]
MNVTPKLIISLALGIVATSIIIAYGFIGNNEIKLSVDYSQEKPYAEMALQCSKDVFIISDAETMKQDVTNKLQITFTPQIEYSIKPLDASNCIIELYNPLPANEYRFSINIKGCENKDCYILLNNKEITLNKEYIFRTPLLQVVSVSKDSKVPNSAIRMQFNFPVLLEAVKKNVTISPKVDFDCSYDTNDATKKTVIIYPKNEKKASSYKLTVSDEMVPIGGKIGMDSSYKYNYETYYPLTVMDVQSSYGRYNDDTSFYPDYPVEFVFNNPIQLAENESITKYVTVSPDPGGVQINYYGSTISVSGNFIGKKEYTITIAKNLKDIYGQTLGETFSEEIEFEHAFSYFSCPAGYMIMESYFDKILPLRMVNVSSFKCKFLSLSHQKDIAEYMVNPQEYFNKKAKEKKYTINWSWDVYKTIKFDFSKLHGQNYGLFVYSITPEMENSSSNDAPEYKGVLQLSDIGVTVKKTKYYVLIHVRSLLDNSPIEGASIFCDSGVYPETQTNSKGVAIIKNNEPMLYTIKHNQSIFYYSVFNGNFSNNDEYDYEYDYDEDPLNGVKMPKRHYGSDYYISRPEMQLFTDRFLYKPGEKVHVKGIFRYRNNDEWSLNPTFSPIKNVLIKVFNSKDDEIEAFTKPITDTGSISFDIALKKDYPTGYYRIEASANNKKYDFSESIRFQVEEFKPSRAEMKIIPDKLKYNWGDVLGLDLFGWYLFGAPVMNDVEYTVLVTPIVYKSEKFPDFSFSTRTYYYDYYDEYSPSPTAITSGKVKVNEKGIAKVYVPLKAIETIPNADIMVTAKTYLSDDSPVFGAKSGLQVLQPVHFGVRVPQYFNYAGSPFTVQLIAVNSDDAVVQNNTVKLIVKRHEWKSFQIAGVNGRLQWEYKKIETNIYSKVHSIGREDVAIVINEPGYYTAEVYDSKEKQKYAVQSFYIIGRGEASWRVNDDETVDIETDKKSYTVGETALLLVKNPFENAVAFVTVEREKFFDYFEVPATSSIVTIPVTITEEHIPNVYVSVMLYTGRNGFDKIQNGEDLAKPKCYIGYANIKVTPREKRLHVQVKTNKKQYKPGEQTTVDIYVTNHLGQPVNGEATISVADRGVLNLVNYTLPNPIDFFYAPRELAVTTFDVRQIILGQRYIKEKGELIGGDGGIASMGMIVPRANIKFTAYYQATIKVENGQARVTFTLPDNLTSFKSMVVVHTPESKFGYGETTFEIKKPLMVLPTFTRFVRVGDSFNAGGLIFNYTGVNQKVTVGLELKGGMKLKDGKSSQIKEIMLNNGQSTEVLFPIVVSGDTHASYVIKAQAGAHTDGITDTIPVKAPNIYETVALYGRITKQQDTVGHTLDISKNILPYVSNINVYVSPSAFTDLKGSLDYLVEYPYGCLEQKASKILPLILGEDIILQKNLLKVKSRQELRDTVKAVLAEFPSYFKGDGFSYWTGEYAQPSSYLTVYATFVLTMAKKRGYVVDEAVFKKALETVKRFATKSVIFKQEESWFSTEYKYLTLSFAHYVAALNGITSESEWKLVYSTINKNYDDMSSGYAYLLKALSLYPASSFKQNMIKEVSERLFSLMRSESGYVYFDDVKSWGYFYYDNEISTALILQALLESGVKFENDFKVVNYLLKQRKGYAWLNTHSNALIWWALNTYLVKYEKEKPEFSVKVLFNTRELLTQLVNNENVSYSFNYAITPDDFGRKSLQFIKNGKGIAYYTMRYQYIPVYDAMTSKDMGFEVTKIYRDAKSNDKVTVFKKGAEYIVEIEVYTPKERGITVLDDELPAGFEPVNITFATEEKSTTQKANYYDTWGTFNHYEQYNDRVVYYADFLKKGRHTIIYRVRATNTGVFKLPACKAEEMYNPEVFGIQYYSNMVQVQ